jgi:H+-transporting ATPase
VDIVTVVVVWAYSIGVTIIIAMTYYVLTSIPWLDDLGRQSRSKADTKIENIIGHLSKLAIEHEVDHLGRDHYHLSTKTTLDEEEE